MMTVLITGGTGLVGTRLADLLSKKGYNVKLLSSHSLSHPKYKIYKWDWEDNYIEKGALDQVDYIIHLAGAGIFEKRWTLSRKKMISDSRIASCRLLYEHIKQNNIPLKAFISASAVGYYGAITSNTIFKESDEYATDFLGDLCRKWETMASCFNALNIRTVKLRTGVVISKEASVIKTLAKTIKLGFGAVLGSGVQFIPWIHINDLCEMYIKAIENEVMSGAYNAVAPQHVTIKQFTVHLAGILKKKIWLPNIPESLLKIIFGERSQLVLTGSRVSSQKIESVGYKFIYPQLETALNASIKNNSD